MNNLISPDDLHLSDRLIEDLALLFEFDLRCAGNDTSWITLDPPVHFVAIAGDGAGGLFLLYGEGDTKQLPVLYLTSEGQAGRIASTLTEFFGVVLDLPYWCDLLKFSNNGSLLDMRKTAKFAKPDHLEFYPELPTARRRIMDVLAVPKINDPIKTLHDAVHATDCIVVAPDGSRYDVLFNSFISSDNRDWRDS